MKAAHTKLIWTTIALFAVFLSGCTTPDGRPAQKTYSQGTIGGGLLGAGVGALIGELSAGEAGTGALIGGAAGTALGFAAAHQKARQRDHYARQYDTVTAQIVAAQNALNQARSSRLSLNQSINSQSSTNATLRAQLQSSRSNLAILQGQVSGLRQLHASMVNQGYGANDVQNVANNISVMEREEQQLGGAILAIERALQS